MTCRRPDFKPVARQQGAALVLAMLVFALSTAIIVAMKGDFTRLYQRSANVFLGEQAYAYLRGAEELAGIALIADYDQDRGQEAPRDDLQELWAQPTAPYPLEEGGWLRGSLQDLQGRFNLNSLVGGNDNENSLTPAQAQFIRLLQALGEPAVSEQEARLITAAVTDWLDPDQRPVQDGAEDAYYFSRSPAHRVANRPMASVSELRAVANVTPEIYLALQPYVTVWPQSASTLNINTAPALVLRSINSDNDLSPLSEADGESLVSMREEAGFPDLDAFLASPVFDGRRDTIQGLRPLLGQQSSYFLLEAEVEVADRNMRLYSVLERRDRQVTALARASGSL
jgi:general secretion pathway protein K